jgi:hypothetical protein
MRNKNRKKLFAFIVLSALTSALMFSGRSYATTGVNSEMSFEGKIVNSSGVNITNGTYNMEFKIYAGGTATGGGTLDWTEDYLVSKTQAVTFSGGTFQVNLGSICSFAGGACTANSSITNTAINWNTYPLYLSIQVGSTASCTPALNFTTNCTGDGEMSPYILLTSTPYSLNSNALGGLTSASYVQTASANTIQPTTNATGLTVLQNAAGSPTADILDIDTANSTGVLQVQAPSLNTANVVINAVGTANNVTINPAGTGTLFLGSLASANTVQIGSTTLSSGTQTINIGNDNTAGGTTNVTIGAGSSASGGTTTIQGNTSLILQAGNTLDTITSSSDIIKNSANSTTALQVQTAASTSVLNTDTVNGRVGIDNSYASLATPVISTSSTATTGGTLAQNTTYYYEVTAIDGAGGESLPSTQRSQLTGNTTATNTITLTWAPVSGAAGYRVYRSTTSGVFTGVGYYATLGTVSSSNLTFIDTNGTKNNTSATPPTTATGYDATNNSNNTLQLSVGGNGTPTGQLYVSGTVPSGAIGSIGTVTGLSNAVVQGSYAYTVSNFLSTLQIYNVANPAEPVKVGSVSTGATSQSEYLYVSGKYAYLPNYGTGTLGIFDVSNPANPVRIANISTGTGSEPEYVYVSGNYAYVSVFNTNTLLVFNVTNPANPVEVGSVATDIGPQDVYVSGNYAYVVNETSESLMVYNIANPANPVQVSDVFTGAGSAPQSIYISGSYAYVASDTGTGLLMVYDITNPTAPVQVGSVTTGNGSDYVYVSGRYAYVSNFAANTVTVDDISSPSNPVLVGTISTGSGSNPVSFWVSGRYGYVGNTGTGTMAIYDLGGTYDQQLQAGSTETGSLQVDANANLNGDTTIQGSLTTGNTIQDAGNLGVAGGAIIQGSTALNGGANQLAAPTAPTVTPTGGSATAKTYSYTITAINASGNETTASPTGTTAVGYTTLTATAYNALAWTAVPGATGYKIYRTVVTGGSPTTLGLIGSSATNSFNDTGLAGSGNSSPTLNATAQLSVVGSMIVQTSTNSTTAFQVQTTANASVLTADTVNSRVSIDTSYAVMTPPVISNISSATTGGILTAIPYYYEITAVDGAGGETSASNQVTITPTTGTSTVTLTWAPVAGAVAYHLYRSTTNGVYTNVGYTSINGTVASSNLTFTDFGSGAENFNATPPTVATANAYVATNSSNSSLQLSVGGNGTPTGQLYVSGTVPTGALSSSYTLDSPDSTFVVGSYAYVAEEDTVGNTGYLGIYDISNPSDSAFISNTSTGASSAPAGVYVAGNYAYVTDGGTNILAIYNVTNPASPTLAGSITTGVGSAPGALFVSGNYAYVIERNTNQLSIFNISNPANPVLSGSVATGVGPNGISVLGNYAYVTNYTGITMTDYNISNPANPVLVGTVNLLLGGSSDPTGLYASGNYVYVEETEWTTNQGYLVTVNVSNPATPVITGTAPIGAAGAANYSTGIYGSGRYIYLTTISNSVANGWFDTYSIANPTNPTLVGSLPTGTNGSFSFPGSIFVQGRYAYITDEDFGTISTYDLGGAYLQQLQVGNTETGTVQVDNNASIGGDTSVNGGLTTGGSIQDAGNLGVAGGATIQGSTALNGGNNQLAAPAAPTVTPTGGSSAAKTYSYTITATNASGGETPASPVGTTALGRATLSAAVYNALSWSAVPGATGYKIYRTVATGTSPTTIGLIGSSATNSFNDTGLAGSATTSPTLNTTSQLTVQGSAVFANTTNSAAAFVIQNATGVSLLTTNTSTSVIQVGSQTANTNPILIDLNNYSTFADPSSTCTSSVDLGALYYNTASNNVRGCINGVWQDLVSTQDLALMLFGVVPNSGSKPGDLIGASATATVGNDTGGPCKVNFDSGTGGASSVFVNSCQAYSGGREVSVPGTLISLSGVAASSWQNICLNASGVPALLGSSATTVNTQSFNTLTTTNASTYGQPLLCLATIATTAATGTLSKIYDLRTFTTTQKTYATDTTANNGYLGAVVSPSATAGAVVAATSATGLVQGVVVASTGGAGVLGTPNLIIATSGPQWVFASSGTINDIIIPGTVAGVATGATVTAQTNYDSLGIVLNTYATSCAAQTFGATDCNFADFTYLNII